MPDFYIRNTVMLLSLLTLTACSFVAIADNGVNYVANYSSRNYINHSDACEQENATALAALRAELKKEPEFKRLVSHQVARMKDVLHYDPKSDGDPSLYEFTVIEYALKPYGLIEKNINSYNHARKEFGIFKYTRESKYLEMAKEVSASSLRKKYRQKKMDILTPCLLKKYSPAEIEQYKEKVVPSFHDKA